MGMCVRARACTRACACVRRAVCPSTASTPKYPSPPAILKTNKKAGLTLGRKAGYGMGTSYAGRGYPLGHTDPGGRRTNKTTSGPLADSMSDLVRAAEKQEWEKLLVRRLLVVVWYLQRI